MIYPTRRAVVAVAAGIPAALVVGVLAPAGWLAGPIWIGVMLLAMAADALSGGSRSRLALDEPQRPFLSVARTAPIAFTTRFGKGPVPGRAEAALDADDRLGLQPRFARSAVEGRVATFDFSLTPERRGEGRLHRLWVRWTGPLGLVWKQQAFVLDIEAPAGTDLQGVREEAVRMLARDALIGSKTQVDRGEGSEFEALKEFQTGMDPRAIDWKQSARHLHLLAKEFRTERNHHIVMAIDGGRAMCEPVGGAPKVDRAINAGLLLAYACLRAGDRAGFYSFDSAPRLLTGVVSGLDAFRQLQHAAGRIDYSAEETNYTLALNTLAAKLGRRSLVVVFTDFTDPTAAELMIDASAHLLRRHLVLFVVMQDEELEAMVDAEPFEPADISRAVVSAGLLREREAVVARLRRMGAHIVEAPAARIGPALINTYVDLKRRDLL
ncbi:DUF58 domain-containing protein [Caulobacter sp. CCNWLY153]|uniref:DUF58 domain-containing protein n=1 Tax=unclassified Caulobacter TaxID=2648921 RepID=UPI002FF34177